MYRINYHAHNPNLADIISTPPGGKLVFNLAFDGSSIGQTDTILREVYETPPAMNMGQVKLVLIRLELGLPTKNPVITTFLYNTESKTGVGMKH